MDEITKLIVSKTGISEDHARLAIETVIGFLKTKLPAPIAIQLDSIIQGKGIGDIDMDKVTALGGLFGKK
jgi:hypothetical protein